MPGAATGAIGSVGIAVETTSGTYLAPTNYVFVESNSINATPDIIRKDLMGGSRYAGKIKRNAKYKVGGGIAWPLGGNHGARFLRPTFGAVTGMTALTADTVKAATPITTANGISTITVTNTGSVTYVVGAWLQVNTSTASELRQIQTVTTNSAPNSVITVGALIGNATAAAGTAVQQIAQLKFTTAPTSNTIPTLSLSLQEAGQYEWRLPGCYVNTWGIKGDKDDVQVDVNIVGTAAPVKATARTASLTAAEQADMSRPFGVMDTQLVLYQDPAQAGAATSASAQQMATYVEGFDFKWENGIITKPFHDQTQVYRAFPGIQKCELSYDYVNISGRMSEFEDYVGSLAGTTIPMTYGMAINTAATGAAAWSALGLSMPNVLLTDADPARSVGDLLMAKIKGEPIPPTATGDPVTVYLVNNDAAVTTGY